MKNRRIVERRIDLDGETLVFGRVNGRKDREVYSYVLDKDGKNKYYAVSPHQAGVFVDEIKKRPYNTKGNDVSRGRTPEYWKEYYKKLITIIRDNIDEIGNPFSSNSKVILRLFEENGIETHKKDKVINRENSPSNFLNRKFKRFIDNGWVEQITFDKRPFKYYLKEEE